MDCDFLVVGAGMAGASAAYELASATAEKGARIIVLERERIPGYHSTGRSAAIFVESYGDRIVRTLCRASRPFLENPPPGFSEHPLVTRRPLLHLGREDQRHAVERLFAECREHTADLHLIEADEIMRILPALSAGYAACAVLEPGAMDMDVHAIHHGYLRGLKAKGGELVTDAEVHGLEHRRGRWSVATRAGTFSAGAIVNAAGAWADEVARMAGLQPLGLTSRRRTAITFDVPPEMDIGDWPILIDASEEFYFKPDAGRVLGSPADETPSPPCDAQPEELDVALAIDRVGRATVLEIAHIASKWAGLRTSPADKIPAVGPHPGRDDFFWLAGQGGNGITASSAMARILAALATGADLPPDMLDMGLTAADVAPGRLA